jgi:hypothetical protein
MKTSSLEKQNKNEKPSHPKPAISEDAFYLIALVTLLKKSVYPATRQEYVKPAKFVGFRDTSFN